LDGWLFGWLVGWLVGWLAGWFVGSLDQIREDNMEKECRTLGREQKQMQSFGERF
jgi:hypothetical protein